MSYSECPLCYPDPETPEVNEAGWVPGNVNSMCDYVYLADGMGNVRGLVDSSGNVSLQVFDAFGNPQGSGGIPAEATYVDFRCNSDSDFGDRQDADPPRPHEPVERIQKGSFAWRGGEGSQTDRLSRSVHYHESTPQERVAEAFTRPSSGLVYMQARYYDPAVGRFTQLDPVRYGPETFATGQNNRWTYCANDPVNASDPSGLFPVIIVVGALIGAAIGAAVGYYISGSWQGAAIGATIGGVIGALGAWAFASAMLGGTAGVTTIGFTATAASTLGDPNRWVPPSLIQAAINFGTRIPDPQGAAGWFMYRIPMCKNGVQYTLEVLYNPASNLVGHFMYYR